MQQRYVGVQSELDRAYDDRLAGTITDEMWNWLGVRDDFRNWLVTAA